eukprot:m.416434 g.416434  ORF g.416434 m.416434 type:complete len:266 (+) comp21279_c0_seq3:186-983(+)
MADPSAAKPVPKPRTAPKSAVPDPSSPAPSWKMPSKGDKVFIHDEDEVFKLCTVKSVEKASTTPMVTCFDEAYQTATIPAKEAYPANPDNHRAVADNTELMYLHEAALLHNVRERYEKDSIYTYTAYILIAVNPYTSIDIYGHDAIEKYANGSIGSLPPHVYGIANRAYRSLRASKRSQSIVVSGESGAGKTETCKHVMKFFSAVCGDGEIGHVDELEQKVCVYVCLCLCVCFCVFVCVDSKGYYLNNSFIRLEVLFRNIGEPNR